MAVARLSTNVSILGIIVLFVASDAFSVPGGGGVAPPSSFLAQLDRWDALNDATPERTALLTTLCETSRNPSPTSFAELGPGQWNVVYAPHMSTMGRLLFQSTFAPVQYHLGADGTIVSHARCVLTSQLQKSIWLSAAGTYGAVDASESDEEKTEQPKSVSRVMFDQVWTSAWDAPAPIASFDAVPEGWRKQLVNVVGQQAFIEPFAVFPVSYLDESLVVFDFELFGTRICAKKQE